MKNVLFAVLVVLALFRAMIVEARVVEKFQTPFGVFKYEVNFDSDSCGEWTGMCDSIITPTGKRVRLSPDYLPDGSASNWIWNRHRFVGITVGGNRAYLVRSDSVWEYVPRMDTFGLVKRFSEFCAVPGICLLDAMVGWRFSTKMGDVYGLLSEDGISPFRGLLYFEESEGRWILAEYHDTDTEPHLPKSHFPGKMEMWSFMKKMEVEKGVLLLWPDDGGWIYYDPRNYTFVFPHPHSCGGDVALPAGVMIFRDIIHGWRDDTLPACMNGCESGTLSLSFDIFGDVMLKALGDKTYRSTVEGFEQAHSDGVEGYGLYSVGGTIWVCRAENVDDRWGEWEMKRVLVETVTGHEFLATRAVGRVHVDYTGLCDGAFLGLELDAETEGLVYLVHGEPILIREVVEFFD